MKKNTYIECGKIINTHGFKGGLKIDPWCNTPKDFTSLKRIYISLDGTDQLVEKKIFKASVFKQFVLFELDGINNIDIAMT